jgi:hypothetical protein
VGMLVPLTQKRMFRVLAGSLLEKRYLWTCRKSKN